MSRSAAAVLGRARRSPWAPRLDRPEVARGGAVDVARAVDRADAEAVRADAQVRVVLRRRAGAERAAVERALEAELRRRVDVVAAGEGERRALARGGRRRARRSRAWSPAPWCPAAIVQRGSPAWRRRCPPGRSRGRGARARRPPGRCSCFGDVQRGERGVVERALEGRALLVWTRTRTLALVLSVLAARRRVDRRLGRPSLSGAPKRDHQLRRRRSPSHGCGTAAPRPGSPRRRGSGSRCWRPRSYIACSCQRTSNSTVAGAGPRRGGRRRAGRRRLVVPGHAALVPVARHAQGLKRPALLVRARVQAQRGGLDRAAGRHASASRTGPGSGRCCSGPWT